MRISVIIPVYNTGSIIKDVVKNIPCFVDEVIVVNDGSTDAETLLALNEIMNDDRVKVISHVKNCGKGCAMRTGFYNSSGDIIVFMDGDGQHNPHEIKKIVRPILEEVADVVIGSRDIEIIGKRPFIRKISNFLSTKIIQLVTGVRIRDTQSGFRAFRREYVKPIESSGYEVETETLIKAIKCGARVAEVSVERIYNNAQSHFKVRDVLNFIRTVIKCARYRCR